MKAKGSAFSASDDCFAQFDAAFAKLEADLVAAKQPADLSEFEEAFDNIDRQLAAQPEPSPATSPAAPDAPSAPDAPDAPSAPGGSRANLALVPAPAAAFTDSPRSMALAYQNVDELWQRPAGGGTPLERLVGTMQNLLWLQRAIQSRNARIADRVRWEQVANVFGEVRQLCAEFDLQTARVRVEFALKALDQDCLDPLALEIGELVRHIHYDLQACSIAPIARERVWGFSLALDERAQRAFPSAIADVAEAGRCIGFGMHAAAAFHLLRAAEVGRKVLAQAVRFDVCDTEAADWASTITALQTRMIDLAGWPAGPARKAVKNFLTALLSDAREMEETRRRLADGETFQECHAVALWYVTRDFLVLAAERVSEAREALLTADDFIRLA